MNPPTPERPESLTDQIATLIQIGHIERKTSEQIANEVLDAVHLHTMVEHTDAS